MITMKKLKTAIGVSLVCASMMAPFALAAPEETPAEVFGDKVEYSSKTGVIKAFGNVVIKKDGAVMKGDEGEYNTKTEIGALSGNVVADKEDMHLTADYVYLENQNYVKAEGNVYARDNEKEIIGPKAEFFRDKDYVLMDNGGTISSVDGTVTADFLEGWMKDEHYKGKGHVHIICPNKDFEGGGENVEYFGKEEGKAIITGNAWVVQENNRLRSHKLTIYLADEKIESNQ